VVSGLTPYEIHTDNLQPVTHDMESNNLDRILRQVYNMTTMKINIREAREKFSEIINRVSYKGERVVLMSRNKPKALIVGLEEGELIKDEPMRKARRILQLEQIKKVREKLSRKRVKSDSLLELRRLRESRLEKLTCSH
jgi:prevent-host-death family protein